MTVAFISLGSNIEPEKNVLEAVKLLSRHVRVTKISTVYLTEPLQGRHQPKYYNCVVEVDTDIEPRELKLLLRAIEEKLGRKRTEDKYASRTIDLDILLYGDLCARTEELVIPDPNIQSRAFLALALREIEPELTLPLTNKPIKEVAAKFKNQRMAELEKFTETLRHLATG